MLTGPGRPGFSGDRGNPPRKGTRLGLGSEDVGPRRPFPEGVRYCEWAAGSRRPGTGSEDGATLAPTLGVQQRTSAAHPSTRDQRDTH